ncbi:MAG TPA: hypothetical protein VN672_09160 [Solirubrobacteraceae bacterium]|nr:hypothetical protein [Solirubrobacteraceae bacterium]
MLAPLAFTVGALAMLLHGVRLLVLNWRLTIVQVLPAVWIWMLMYDLKAHVLHGKTFHVLRGPVLIPLGLVIIAITTAAFFLNAVFAFAITRSPHPDVRPAVADAKRHLRPILLSGAVAGILVALATTVVTRWGHPWFTLALGIVVGAMMVAYVAVPSRLVGIRPSHSKRDKLAASALSTLMSVTVCTPPYLLGRLGVLMLGSSVLLVPGIVLLVVGATLQAGATGAVRAIKMSASLGAGRDSTRSRAR